MVLSDAADELYGADPAGFVARRAELVKKARAEGDRALAAQIAALRRPTVSAWYLNLLARSGADELQDLIDLGARMRSAQGALDMATVTSLGPQRRTAEQAVMRRLDWLLAERGLTASQVVRSEVSATLVAVAADGSAAEAVRSGCLTRSLVYAGFGEVDLSDAVGAELEAFVDRHASRPEPEHEPEPAPEPLSEPPAPDSEADLLAKARAVADAVRGYDEARAEREAAQREVDELGLAYAAAEERLRTAEAREAEAAAAVTAAEA